MKRLNAGIIGLLLFFVCTVAFATIDATIPTRHDFSGNDVATSFSYTVEIRDQDHLKLVHTDTAGVENALVDPLVVDVDYTVNGVGDAGGGSVDFPKAGSVYDTLATGEKLSIIYDFPIEQTTDLPNTGRVFNENVESQLDYITVLINQQKEKLDRSIKLVEGSTLTDINFPEGTSASNRASKLSAWDSTGTGLELVSIGSVPAIDPIAVKGDIVQGDASGDAAKLAIGGTGAILSVESGLLAYTGIGSTNDVLQVIGGVPAWVSSPIIVLTTPQIEDTSADHQYVFAVSELSADRTITLPLLTGNDIFVFNDFAAVLKNKDLEDSSTEFIDNSDNTKKMIFDISEVETSTTRTVTIPDRNLTIGGVLGTEQASTSGTAIDFTSIPADTRKITIMLVGVSTDGTNALQVQIGDAGGMETTGYASAVFGSGGDTAETAAFLLTQAVVAAGVYSGQIILTLEDSAGFTWVYSSGVSRTDTAAGFSASGSKSLSGKLDRVRITSNGTPDDFDLGAINIQYE